MIGLILQEFCKTEAADFFSFSIPQNSMCIFIEMFYYLKQQADNLNNQKFAKKKLAEARPLALRSLSQKVRLPL